jgi:tetratricopeptide (TPR) repeat protein
MMNPQLAIAAASAAEAIRGGARDPQHYCTLGWYHLQTGDVEAALPMFSSAIALNNADPEALTGMGHCMRLKGQLRDAILHCDAAIRANPDYVEAWLERGYVLASGGSMQSAKACYEKAIALDAGNVAAHAGTASIMARDGDSAVARDHAKRALFAEPDNAIAAAALATMQIEAGEAEAARTLIEPLATALPDPSADRSMLYSLLGDACNKTGDIDTAYVSYAQSKHDFESSYAHRVADRPSHTDYLAGIGRQLAEIEFSQISRGATAPIPNAANKHLFLLGYPRSGNTLVENILASLPGVVALEERPTLVEADMAFLTSDEGLARFAALTDEKLQPYQAAYWDKVQAAGIATVGQCFVDMDPLKGSRLPLIARLFPDARILLMRRDPRDVVWSCFHTNFAFTNAAMDFTSLERAARHYDVMMQLIDVAMERLPLNIHVVHYEALVRNFDNETQALCDFTGLQWSDALRTFDRTAQSRGVSTASAGQVRKGLYDGSRQWERYAKYLEPVLPILQPWIDKFGY